MWVTPWELLCSEEAAMLLVHWVGCASPRLLPLAPLGCFPTEADFAVPPGGCQWHPAAETGVLLNPLLCT